MFEPIEALAVEESGSEVELRLAEWDDVPFHL